MWQPYAIKETIAEFETKTGARFSPTFFDGNSEAFNKMKVGGTKDFDIVQADGFWPRLYFRQGLTQAVDYGKLPNIANVFPGFLPPNFPLLADETGDTRWRRRIAGAAMASPSIPADRAGGYRLDQPAAEREVQGPFLLATRASRRTSR